VYYKIKNTGPLRLTAPGLYSPAPTPAVCTQEVKKGLFYYLPFEGYQTGGKPPK
jgi:hypothetical protein